MKRKGEDRDGHAYDAVFARIFDDAGVDVILVGTRWDVVLGTRYAERDDGGHGAAHGGGGTGAQTRVPRGRHAVPFVPDRPSDAIRNAGGCSRRAEAVKLEGAQRRGNDPGDRLGGHPVMGTSGSPRSRSTGWGLRVQGKTDPQASGFWTTPRRCRSGAFAVVLEGMPAALAGEITRTLSIRRSDRRGAGCDGQVLVMHDLLGCSTNSGRSS